MNSRTTQPFIKSKEPTQNSIQSRSLELPITDIQRQYRYDKSFNTERIKSVDFFVE